MKEYTLISIIFVLITIFLDIRTRVLLLKRIEYYIFLLFILFFKLLVNGYLTSKSIVIYNLEFFMGFRLLSIPFEDFIFGFSMVTMTIILFEYFVILSMDGNNEEGK